MIPILQAVEKALRKWNPIYINNWIVVYFATKSNPNPLQLDAQIHKFPHEEVVTVDSTILVTSE